jgi:hypothetical protein
MGTKSERPRPIGRTYCRCICGLVVLNTSNSTNSNSMNKMFIIARLRVAIPFPLAYKLSPPPRARGGPASVSLHNALVRGPLTSAPSLAAPSLAAPSSFAPKHD